jgi:acylphosphatase
MKRANIIAKGKVQKVGYRDFVQDIARELGIAGYVENLEDGTVKVVCEGEEAKIEEFIRAIKVKKDFIDVSETSLKYEAPTGEFKLFKIKYGDVPEELGDRLGAALLYLGATNQKIDAGFKMMGEKQDRMLEKQDDTIKAIDRSKEEIVTEIRSLRGDLKLYMENKFAKIEHEIEGIKAKIGMV